MDQSASSLLELNLIYGWIDSFSQSSICRLKKSLLPLTGYPFPNPTLGILPTFFFLGDSLGGLCHN